MTPEALLSRLAALNVKLTAAGGRLRVEAPAGALTDELRAALAEHKRALLDLLSRPSRGVRRLGGTERRLSSTEPHDPDPQLAHIPLSLDESPSEWLAKRGLCIVGGDPATGTLFVADLQVGEMEAAV